MGQFNGYDFTYNDIPSQTYGLYISNFGDSSVFNGVGSSDVTVYTQQVLRKAKVYYLGRSQSTPLQFNMTFNSDAPLLGMERAVISNWLFGKPSYKKLQILQDDLNGAWFNCFLTKPMPIYVGNINYGFTCTVVADSPFAYSPLKTTTRTYTGNNVVTDDIVLYNYSDDEDYLYPNITFSLNTVGNSFSITNADDANREFLFTSLSPNETVIINGDLQTITSSTGLHRLGNFNKKWLRLVPGKNALHVESGIGSFSITYYERVKIGA